MPQSLGYEEDNATSLAWIGKAGYSVVKTTVVKPLQVTTAATAMVARSILVKPLIKATDMLAGSYNRDDAGLEYDEHQGLDGDRISLRGTLRYRTGRSEKKWKRRYVVLKFENRGILQSYNVPNESAFKDMVSKLTEKIGKKEDDDVEQEMTLLLNDEIPWAVKDIENNPSTFCIEVPTDQDYILEHLVKSRSFSDHSNEDTHFDSDADDGFTNDGEDIAEHDDCTAEHAGFDKKARRDLERGFYTSRKTHRPLRLYFKCPGKGNEKALWIRAFTKLNRLSSISIRKQQLQTQIANIRFHNSRVRVKTHQFAREARQLEGVTSQSLRTRSVMNLDANIELLNERNQTEQDREYLVSPHYCYPHQWMTRDELREECNLPSEHFHDLRMQSEKGKEIGLLSVEVMQCMGLPKLDRSSDTDAVAYVVCGKYAFATDCIPDNLNPMWLRKSRRACLMPIFHGYARLYVGVFDDDGPGKDDFAGRVVIDISRLRPGCRYDVTIPLRLSAHVYMRRQRGAIRLRLQLDWNSERRALMSYLPNSWTRLPLKQPNHDTFILCTDQSSFKNVMTTVHGVHAPGHFSFMQFRATLKEINYTRKMIMLTIRFTIRDTVTWVNPIMSLFVFAAWMHCVYADSFALVPAYSTTFIMLHMLRNYARFTLEGPSSRGFLPPTLEETFWCLLRGGRGRSASPIEPMEMSTTHVSERIPGVSDRSVRSKTIATHEPRGQTLLRALGFLESQDEWNRTKGNEGILEFPFSPSDEYPKFTVEDSLVPNKVTKKVASPAQQNRNHGDEHDTEGITKYTHASGNRTFHLPHPDSIGRMDSGNMKFHLPHSDGMGRLDSLDNEWDDNDNYDYMNGSPESDRRRAMESAAAGHGEDDDSNLSAENLAEDSEEEKEGIPRYMRIPQQNIDAYVEKKKITDDLADIEDKLHELTWYNFRDATHTVPNPKATYFGQGRRSSSKRRNDVHKELKKLLQVGEYSHSNPIVSRVGLYLGPLVGACQSILCLVRALFNAFTFQDPFLSFWIFIFGWAITAILFFFPWRLFMLVAGILVMGPQNWLFRKINERRKKRSAKAKPEEEGEKKYRVPRDQPLFKAHPPPNVRYHEIDRSRVNANAIHHAVVPYSPLMYQRFYDWPPEPEYSHVRLPPPPKRRSSMAKFKPGDDSVVSSVSQHRTSLSIGNGGY